MEVNRREAMFAAAAISAAAFSRRVAASPRWSASARRPLSPLERLLLVDLEAQGIRDVSVLIAARTSAHATVLNRVLGDGGTALANFAEVDGLYASIPIARLEAMRNWPEIERFQLTGSQSFVYLGNNSELEPGVSLAERLSRLEIDNPFSGQGSTQAVQFRTANPRFDGRGVIIGNIEELQPNLPSLLWGRALEGHRIPKIVDYVLHFAMPASIGAPEPSPDDDHHVIWRYTESVRPGSTRTASFNGRSYRLPASARGNEIRICRHESVRDGLAVTSLWDVESEKVWLLADAETDFDSVTPVDVAAEITRRVTVTVRDGRPGDGNLRPVILRAGRDRRIIGLQLYYSDHADMTATVAAGHNFFGSRAGGVAPGALLLVHFTPRRALRALDLPHLESALASILDDRNDLVSLSSSIEELAYGADQSVAGLLAERAIDISGIPVFSAADNGGPQLSIIEAVSGADAVIAVGGYVPNEPRRAIYGVESTETDCLASYSSWGPREDGGLKPELVSITEIMSGDTTASDLNVHRLRLGAGTSAAAPSATGHAALLISAAKQENIPIDPGRMKIALFSTARFMSNIEARAQGHGLIQVADAWKVLRRLRHYDVPRFRTEAPVRTYRSAWFKTPNVGAGIFEQIGWTPNSTGEREIRITRTAGPPRRQEYLLRWKGQTSAFASPLERVRLGFNETISIPISIRVGESGAYSAILDLIDPTLNVIVHSVLCTIFVAEQLNADNGFRVELQRTMPRPGNSVIFIDVPPETSLLSVEVRQHGGALLFRPQLPSGNLAISGVFGSANRYEREAPAAQDFERTFVDPEPGVWQIWLKDGADQPRLPDDQIPSSRSRRLDPVTLSLTMSAYGVSGRSVPASPRNEQPRALFANGLRPVPVAEVKSLGLGSERIDQLVLRPGSSAIFQDIEVPTGATELEAEIMPQTSAGAHVTLAILRVSPTHQPWITGAHTAVMALSVGPGARKRVQLRNPPAGSYRIAIDPVVIPEAGLTVAYRDALFHPTFGSLDVEDGALPFAPATSRTAAGTPNVRARPDQGRQLVARMGLFSNEIANIRFEPGDPQAPDTSTRVIVEHHPLATVTVPIE